MPTDFIALFGVLAAAQVRFVLVGGLALVLHGLDRLWQATHHMQVFSFWDSTNARPTVDIMLDPAVSFDELWSGGSVVTIGGHDVRIASVRHLIRLKEAAGRPQDLADLGRLRAMLAE